MLKPQCEPGPAATFVERAGARGSGSKSSSGLISVAIVRQSSLFCASSHSSSRDVYTMCSRSAACSLRRSKGLGLLMFLIQNFKIDLKLSRI